MITILLLLLQLHLQICKRIMLILTVRISCCFNRLPLPASSESADFFSESALIYIKSLYVFHWPTFSSPRSFPQVHVSCAEELCRPLPTPARQAAGPDGPCYEGPVDQGVEGLQGWSTGQTLWAAWPTLSYPGDPCGHLPRLCPWLWFHGGWSEPERHHGEPSEGCAHVRNGGHWMGVRETLRW